MAVAIGLPAMAPAQAADSTVRVDENGDAGWAFNPDARFSTPYEFTTAEQSIGGGSLHVLPITNTNGTPGSRDKFVAAHLEGTLVSDLSSISYDFLIAGNGTVADASDFYLNVYTNLPGSTTFFDCRFDYVPLTGSNTAWTSVTFDANDVAVQERLPACPTMLDQMPAGSTVSFFSLNVGDSSFTDTGLAGYYDNVVVATTGGTTTYDFEAKPPSKDACKKGGHVEYGYPNQGACVSAVAAGK